MIALYTALIPSLFFGIAQADCFTFKETSWLGNHNALPQAFSSTGVPLVQQRQQVSKALTCPANHNGSDGHYNINCKPDQCYHTSFGTQYASAMTNLSYASPDLQAANGRIASLVLGAVDWKTKAHHEFGTFGTYFEGSAKGIGQCLDPGASGILFFVPNFACVSGTLHACGPSTSALERNGMAVTVCMPYAIKDSNGEFIPQGYSSARVMSGKLASEHRANPAATYSAGVHQYSTSTWTMAAAMACMVSVFFFSA